MVFWVLSDLFKLHFLFNVGLVLFVCIIVFMLIYMNTNNRFKK
jgi:ABC-type phosphate transport system permease subunit